MSYNPMSQNEHVPQIPWNVTYNVWFVVVGGKIFAMWNMKFNINIMLLIINKCIESNKRSNLAKHKSRELYKKVKSNDQGKNEILCRIKFITIILNKIRKYVDYDY